MTLIRFSQLPSQYILNTQFLPISSTHRFIDSLARSRSPSKFTRQCINFRSFLMRERRETSEVSRFSPSQHLKYSMSPHLNYSSTQRLTCPPVFWRVDSSAYWLIGLIAPNSLSTSPHSSIYSSASHALFPRHPSELYRQNLDLLTSLRYRLLIPAGA